MLYYDRIQEKLSSELSPSHLTIVDESRKHAGHVGARPGGETHFQVTIVSDRFSSMKRLERYRLVHQILASELEERVHALSLTLQSPEEAAPSE